MASRPAPPRAAHMARTAQVVRRWAILIHRWMGVALCALFTLWFATGIVMMYWSFPEVTEHDRLAHAAAIEPWSINVTPSEAWSALGRTGWPRGVTLGMVDGRPAYRFEMEDATALVYADDARPRPPVSAAMVRLAARGWAGGAAGEPRVEAVIVADQWTLEGPLRTMRPLWKFEFPDGQTVYVYGPTGEVVQYTTPRARAWAWVGPIPHFLYFAALRRHRDFWRAIVIALSGLGALSALLGLCIAWSTFSPAKRFRRAGAPAHLPYSGLKRWHDIIGLCFGVAVVTWSFSGMMSVDPFPRRDSGSRAGAVARTADALRGARVDVGAFAARTPRDALLAAPSVAARRLELATLDGEPVYVATDSAGHDSFIPLRGAPFAAFGPARAENALRVAAAPAQLDIQLQKRYDAWYRDRRRELPLPVLRVMEHGADTVRLYVDPATMRVVGEFRGADWAERWLYHGLHSLDFPWLYEHRPLWDIVMITLLLGGWTLSLTSLYLAWQVLRRRPS